MEAIKIGLIGDFNPRVVAHEAISKALHLAAEPLGIEQFETCWLPTASLAQNSNGQLEGFAGLWCVPGSPYSSMDGALEGIRFARSNGVPFLGTCGGFQHAIIEYARNVLGLTDAEHAESNPAAKMPLISSLSCSLVEKEARILLQEDSIIRSIYGRSEIIEAYHCNYGFNPVYHTLFKSAPHFQFTGWDQTGDLRVFELKNHPFFIATLFQPERSASSYQVHPLIKAYLEAIRTGGAGS
jgi:CTP synthase (UTP-ammonia lyase)